MTMHYEIARAVKNIIVLPLWKLTKQKNILRDVATGNFEESQPAKCCYIV